MGKRRIKLGEDDLKVFLTDALRSSGYMTEVDEIIGFEYMTHTIKKGGDYYKDGVDDQDYPGEVEVVKSIKVLMETGRKKNEDDSSQEDDDNHDADQGESNATQTN